MVLEITETSMIEDADGAIATLQALKALGVRLAIDDFGTGYSSLSYLRRLPVDVLKLDRSFVVPSGRGDRESALVDAVFRLGRSLGLVTIAEGIEDAEQRDRLISLGCRVGQGYLFARPMAEPEALEFLKSYNKGAGRELAERSDTRPRRRGLTGRAARPPLQTWAAGAAPDKEEPRGGRVPGFRRSELVAGRGFEPLTFGL